MHDMAQAAKTVDELLQCVVREGGFNLTCSVTANAIQGLHVIVSGPDTALLIERNGELLHALKLLATQAAGFEQGDRHRIEFELDGLGVARQLDCYPLDQETQESSESLWQNLVLCSVKDEPAGNW